MVSSHHPSGWLRCLPLSEAFLATPTPPLRPVQRPLPSAEEGVWRQGSNQRQLQASGQEWTSLYAFPHVAGHLPSWFLRWAYLKPVIFSPNLSHHGRHVQHISISSLWSRPSSRCKYKGGISKHLSMVSYLSKLWSSPSMYSFIKNSPSYSGVGLMLNH